MADAAACLSPPLRLAPVGHGGRVLFRMAVGSPSDDLISRRILAQGRWEIGHPQELADLAEATLGPALVAGAPARRTFLDVGANIGYYSLLFAHHGFDVIAVEPMARNRKVLEASLCLNPQLRARVRVVPTALASAEQVASGATCVIRQRRGVHDNVGNGRLLCGHGRVGLHTCDARVTRNDSCHAVGLRTLDEVLAALGPRSIDVAKVDVEGSECAFLSGARSLFASHQPAFVQWEGKDRKTDRCMREAAGQHGYRIGLRRGGTDQNTVMTTMTMTAGEDH